MVKKIGHHKFEQPKENLLNFPTVFRPTNKRTSSRSFETSCKIFLFRSYLLFPYIWRHWNLLLDSLVGVNFEGTNIIYRLVFPPSLTPSSYMWLLETYVCRYGSEESNSVSNITMKWLLVLLGLLFITGIQFYLSFFVGYFLNISAVNN